MTALIKSALAEHYCAIGAVISNRPDAPGLAFAAEHDIDTLTIDHTKYPTREAFDEALDAALRQRKIDLVALAGFMRILSADFVSRWLGKLINIHPSLLPAFPGVKVHEQVLAAGVRESGATVHFVVPELDSGPIIGQAKVPVLKGDTPETLGARVLQTEHKLYPPCLRLLCENRVHLENGRTVFTKGAAIVL